MMANGVEDVVVEMPTDDGKTGEQDRFFCASSCCSCSVLQTRGDKLHCRLQKCRSLVNFEYNIVKEVARQN